MTGRRMITGFVAGALLAGCGDTIQPLEPAGEFAAAMAAQGSTSEIGGAWILDYENFIHLDEFSAQLFGFEPEGTRTTIRCTASESLTLQQDGSSFTGTLVSGGTVCETSGGQSVSYPPGGSEEIVAGDIQGRSIHFTLLGTPGPVECPAHGAIRAVEGDLALQMSGNWRCLEPGHPQSLWQAPPPRGGPNRTLWEAYRP